MKRHICWLLILFIVAIMVPQHPYSSARATVIQPQLAEVNADFLNRNKLAHLSVAPLKSIVQSPVDWSYLDGKQVFQSTSDVSLPESYDLRTDNRVTAVRNQSTSSACWTFAAYGSLESTMMPEHPSDFSENNMKNCSGFDPSLDSGGNGDMSTAYLVRWSGPINETDDPYDTNLTASPSGLVPTAHVQNVLIIPERADSLDTTDIKSIIMDKGAVTGAICWEGNKWSNSSFYNVDNGAYYYTGSSGSDHDVTIVGWDNNYASTNFSTTPAGNGAWIVKNSWGKDWGKDGYFYISYYDKVLFKQGSSYCFLAAEPSTNYADIYQYDPLGHSSSIGYGSTTAWAANIFTASSTEYINAIGFYTLDVNTSYEAKIYATWNGSSFEKLLSSTSGNIAIPGYHTIVLPERGASVTSGKTFGVVIKFSTQTYKFPVAIEKPIAGYSMKATAHTGESFISSDGISWIDVTSHHPNSNVCIKAYGGAPATPVTLTCSASPAQSGTVAVTPMSDTGTYPADTVVILTAKPASGYTFAGWSGDTDGTMNPLSLTLDRSRSAVATFSPLPPPEYVLSVSVSGMGYVTRTPSADTYAVGTQVQLLAVPSDGWTFAEWEGSLAGAGNPASIVVDAACAVTARFERLATPKHAAAVTIGSTTMTVDGIATVLDAAPVIQNGRTLLPIRAVVEAFGGTIGWQSLGSLVAISLNGHEIAMQIGNGTGRVDGTSVPIDAADARIVPVIITSRTFLPLRFVAENLGLQVEWDNATQTVKIWN